MSVAEQVVIKSPEPQDSQAHVDAMIAKVDGTPAPEGAPAAAPEGERPAWLPEKFKTAEDFAKSYAELEAKQSGKAPEAAPAPEATSPEGTPKAPEGEAATELASKGLDLAEFSTEFSKSGSLSAESYTKLEAAGYPKAIVDGYIAGQQALAVQFESEVKSASGEVPFDDVHAWAATNLSPADATAYNAAIDSGDVAKAKLAVQGITAKYQAAYPPEGQLVTGKSGVPQGEAYESLAQMKADMADPKYKNDPAFRAKVASKLGNSNIL